MLNVLLKHIKWQYSDYIVHDFNNLGVYAVKTRNCCRDSPAILP